MTRRAPGFGVGTSINPGTTAQRLEPQEPRTRRFWRDGVLYEIDPLTAGPRSAAVRVRVVRAFRYDGDET